MTEEWRTREFMRWEQLYSHYRTALAMTDIISANVIVALTARDYNNSFYHVSNFVNL
jgi:hypothetical protein